MATSVIDIIIGANWTGGQAANRAVRDLDKLDDAALSGSVQMAAAAQRTGLLENKLADLGQQVALGNKTIDQATQEYREFADGLTDVGDVTEDAGLNFATLATNIGIAAAAIGGAVVATQQLYRAASQGAALNQLEQSFDRLNESVLQTPNLLEDMQTASRNTISEARLMAGVMILTAGAAEEVARAMAEAAPQLVEIAKAATVLNPTLGDTATVYESLATGIKRSSPLLIDNAGIAVKVGAANEALAESLGKSVEELTAEEKQLALLNETLRAGQQLIEQVGGSVDSQTDSWNRLKVEIEETTNAWKRALADGLLPTAEAMSGTYADAIDDTVANNIEAAESIDDLIAALEELQREQLEFQGFDPAIRAVFMRDVAREFEEGTAAIITEMARASDSTEEFMDALAEAFGTSARGWNEFVSALSADEFNELFGEIDPTIEAFFQWVQAQEAVRKENELLARSLPNTQLGVEALNQELEGTAPAADDAADSLFQLSDIVNFTGDRYRQGRAAIEEYHEGVERQQEAAQEAAAAQERMNSILESAQSSLSQAGGRIAELANAYRDLEAAGGRIDASTLSIGDLLEEDVQDALRAQNELDAILSDIADSYRQMMLDIITATDGFDEAAARFAVASGLMTEAEAEMRLETQRANEALASIAQAVDDAAISPEVGAALFEAVTSAAVDTETKVETVVNNIAGILQRLAEGAITQEQAEAAFQPVIDFGQRIVQESEDAFAALRDREQVEIGRALDREAALEEDRLSIIERFGERRAQEEEDWQRHILRQEQQLNRDIAQAREDSAERQAEARANADKRLLQLEEDYHRERERINEDAARAARRAASRLDASALFDIEEQRQIDLGRADEDFEDEQAAIEAQLQEQLEAAREAEEERIADLREHLAQRQEIEAEDRQIRLQREQDAHDARIAEIETQQEELLAQIQQQGEAEQQALQDQFDAEEQMTADHWKEIDNIATGGLQLVLEKEQALWRQRQEMIDGLSGGSSVPSPDAPAMIPPEPEPAVPTAPAGTQEISEVTLNIEPGAIQIMQQPGESPDDVAIAVIGQLEQFVEAL